MRVHINILLAFLLMNLFFVFEAESQQLKGHVRGIDGKKHEILLPGANVYWMSDMQGTVTNDKGDFVLKKPADLPSKLIVSFIGYRSDTILITESTSQIKVELISELILEEFILSEKRGTSFYSKVTPYQVQVLTACELKKAACCNLAESFETNASVDVTFADALTGVRQIELLGLAGIYTQMQFENIPAIRGLAAPYGMTFVPGPWIESIQISKGTASVRNGFEAITGQINYEYLKPDKSDRFYLNLYGNHSGKSEMNLYTAHKFNDKWSNMILFHANLMPFKEDHNHDDFLDMPLQKQINFYYRLKYNTDKGMSQFGVGFLNEEKQGGQLAFDPSKDRGTTNAYGLGIDTRRLEVFWKGGYFFPKHEQRSLALFTSASLHEMNSYFGLKTYNANQQSVYFNSIFKDELFNNEKHEVAAGFSFMLDRFDESLNDSNFARQDVIPGAFIEYSFKPSDKFTLVAGLRDDYHFDYGNMFTPRLHLRYMINDHNILRASAGKGYRFPHIIAENMSVLASSKVIVFNEQANMEEAWNYGVFYSREFNLFKKNFILNLDFYRTDFINQVIVDMSPVSMEIFIYNLDGKSYANSFQAELSFEPIERLDVMIAYRVNDVKTTYDGVLEAKLFSKRSKGVLNLSYATDWEKWRFDLTAQHNGTSRLPLMCHDDGSGNLEYSPPFFLFNAQITRNFKKLEFYTGIENLTNFTQHHPIIEYEYPFSSFFDASRIWGPIFGRKIYAGLRLIIP